MSPKPSRALPAIFHRLFLSHLIVVLLCFVAGLILMDYLFADGLHYYRVHSPLIVIPTLLGLIGLAGLLALWTSGTIAIPLHRFSESMGRGPDHDTLLALRDSMGSEEGAMLAESTADMLARIEQRRDTRPYTLIVDVHLNILTIDVDTAARLGMLQHEVTRMNLRDILADPADLAEAISRFASALPAHSSQPLRLALRAAAGRTVRPLCHILPLPNGTYLITGVNAVPSDE